MLKVIFCFLLILQMLHSIDFEVLKAQKKQQNTISINMSNAVKAGNKEWEQYLAEKAERRRKVDKRYEKNNCRLASGNAKLFNYCMYQSCNYFSSNYAVYQLCENNSVRGFYGSNKFLNIRHYLEKGTPLNYDYFEGQVVYQSGKFNGDFEERKKFIIYLLNGVLLMKY